MSAFATRAAAILIAAALLAGAPATAAVVKGPETATAVAKRKKAASRPARNAEPPREAWQRPLTVVLVRSSVPGCEPLCPEWLAAEGEITSGSPPVFRKALKQTGGRRLPLLIRSPGGDVNAALEIGRMVRRLAAMG